MTNKLTFDQANRMFSYDHETGTITRAKSGQIVGSVNSHGYLRVEVTSVGSRRTYSVHRLAWLLHTGDWPSSHIDHINGIKTDNRIANLRDVTPQQNNWNLHYNRRNTSGFTGVSWHKGVNKWQAQIKRDGKHCYLGLFTEVEEAAAAYAAAKDKLHAIGLRQ